MKFTTLLLSTSDRAIEAFRNEDLRQAYRLIDDLRTKTFFDCECVGNLRVDFEELGLDLDAVNGQLAEIMQLFDKLQMRLCQLKNYYETEKHIKNRGDFGNCFAKASKPVWRI